jgi:hypothetical protein
MTVLSIELKIPLKKKKNSYKNSKHYLVIVVSNLPIGNYLLYTVD